MRIIYFLSGTFVFLLLFSCGQKRKDVTYYEQMVDSIRKAEQMKEITKQMKSFDSPVEAFFDTLQIRPLPIRSEGSHIEKIGAFGQVPGFVVSQLGYPAGTQLKALLLPQTHHHHVVLLKEQCDSVKANLHLCTLDGECRPIDRLCLYEEVSEDRIDDFGRSYMDYFITSDYEITLIFSYESYNTHKVEVEQTRRYIINSGGYIEEEIVEID